MVDRNYCANSFLTFRTIADTSRCFSEKWKPQFYKPIPKEERYQVWDDADLERALAEQMRELTKDGRAALALSGGIDSAILAKFMPKGSKAYTFQCVVPGIEVVNEVPSAAAYAQECGLEHEVIPIYWEDFEEYAPVLMRHKGAPIHSIEVQIYKAALKAKRDGFERLIFGESADVNYGGMNGLLSKNWTIGEFIDRYSYASVHHILKKPQYIVSPFLPYENDGYYDAHNFVRDFFMREGMGSYTDACSCAGIELAAPYANTWMAAPLDLARIRSGENKYIVREVFKRLYPNFEIPPKLPMPRATDQWLAGWTGPTREEFWPHCTDHMTGDQKWLVWALEKFLNILDE